MKKIIIIILTFLLINSSAFSMEQKFDSHNVKNYEAAIESYLTDNRLEIEIAIFCTVPILIKKGTVPNNIIPVVFNTNKEIQEFLEITNPSIKQLKDFMKETALEKYCSLEDEIERTKASLSEGEGIFIFVTKVRSIVLKFKIN